MAFLLSALIGPIIQAFTQHGSGSIDAATSSLAATEQADQVPQ